MPSMFTATKSRGRISKRDFVATQRQCENCTQCAIALGKDVEYVCATIKELCEEGYSKILRYYPDYSVALAKNNAKKRLAASLADFAEIIEPEEANGETIVVPNSVEQNPENVLGDVTK